PVVKGLPATHPGEGARKTKPLSEGTTIDPKDVRRNIQLTDIDYTSTLVTDLSRLALKPDTEPLILTTVGDIQALLGDFKDELKDDSDENVYEVREEMDEEILQQYENTDVSLGNYQKIITQFMSDRVARINKMLINLQEVQNVVKEDLALNKKMLEAAQAYTKNSTNLTELFTLEAEVAEVNMDIKTIPVTIVRPIAKSVPEAHKDKEERLEKAAKEARLMQLSKPTMIKVVTEVAIKAGVDQKIFRAQRVVRSS
nr:hypothetical protein [Tanacetum cinerariifolium]